MELPIDHFRLLGVSPSAEADAILRALQLRLDRSPSQGFTYESLSQRGELLQLSADLLTDLERRQEYEVALLGGASGLEFPSRREVAGLILLWEANASQEAFQLACKCLQPPQAPALGSGREADLTLLAALACRDASNQEQQLRHYEAAASLLQEGIQLLQRMGKLAEYRNFLEEDLESLLPYRILDLVSRDLGDKTSRVEGIRLLEKFVHQRGGLEGKSVSSLNVGGLHQNEFEIFFQQIRKFLTVQEQVDLFISWQKAGSTDAGFLLVIALVAVGFSRRKPEMLHQAKRHLQRIDLDGLDALPLLGCLDLLLADVELAKTRFESSQDSGLKDWLDNYPGASLGALCDYCCDWLRRDVLPGYRDVDSKFVDLEAWFADREVQAFVEKLDQKGNRGKLNSKAFSFLSSLASENSFSIESFGLKPDDLDSLDSNEKDSNLDEQKTFSEVPVSSEDISDIDKQSSKEIFESILNNSLYVAIKRFHKFYKPFLMISVVSIASICAIIYQDPFGFRKKKLVEIPQNSSSSQVNITEDSKRKQEEENIEEASDSSRQIDFNETTLTSKQPSKRQLKSAIEAWLLSKSVILSGGKTDILPMVARKQLQNRVKKERKEDLSLKRTKIIQADIISFDIVSRAPNRIEVKTIISYRDKVLESSEDIVSESFIPKLSVNYVFGRDEDSWRIHDYISGS